MPCAYLMSVGTFVGSSNAAAERRIDAEAVMASSFGFVIATADSRNVSSSLVGASPTSPDVDRGLCGATLALGGAAFGFCGVSLRRVDAAS
jgi:hypothetical protein